MLNTRMLFTVSVLISLLSYPVSAKSSSHCEYYSKSAVSQNKENIKYGCGYKSIRWSNNLSGQKKWCSSVSRNISRKEQRTRNEMLVQCYKQYAIRDNRSNQITIPPECIDIKTKYIPLRSYYRDKMRIPVENGLIEHDLNSDGKTDYVYIEVNKEKEVQLSACISNNESRKSQYDRIVTAVSFSYGKSYVHGIEYNFSLKGDLIQSLVSFSAHNEGSSGSVSIHRYDSTKKKFTFVESREDSTPVHYDFGNGQLEPYPLFIPPPALL